MIMIDEPLMSPTLKASLAIKSRQTAKPASVRFSRPIQVIHRIKDTIREIGKAYDEDINKQQT